MSTMLRLSFPGRRYHATPWGSHANEGLVEWPPSPWRLLRALLSTGFTKLRWPDDGPPPVAHRLFTALAGTLPRYALPRRLPVAHSRHYVEARDKTPLIFDTWVHVGCADCLVSWDVTLGAEERALLADLARHLGYLGRAESLVQAGLLDEGTEPAASAFNCVPSVDQPPNKLALRERQAARDNCVPSVDQPPPNGEEAIRLACPLAPAAYDAWRTTRLAATANDASPGKKGKGSKRTDESGNVARVPKDLVTALMADSGSLQDAGWSTPPGFCERVYFRPADALTVGQTQTRRATAVPSVPLALFALSTPSRGMSALPPLGRVYPQGRLFGRALMGVVNRGGDDADDLALRLLGRAEDGPARHNHRHAHMLALDLDQTSRLNHILLFVPMGLDGDAQEALRHVRRTFMKGGVGELEAVLAAVGDAATMRGLPAPVGPALTHTLGPAGGSMFWRSATPFIPPRFVKPRGKDSVVGQVRAECTRRGLPQVADVLLAPLGQETIGGIRHFVLHDESTEPPLPARYDVRLKFVEPVSGPLCLGYGCHAGLGRFVTDEAPRA